MNELGSSFYGGGRLRVESMADGMHGTGPSKGLVELGHSRAG